MPFTRAHHLRGRRPMLPNLDTEGYHGSRASETPAQSQSRGSWRRLPRRTLMGKESSKERWDGVFCFVLIVAVLLVANTAGASYAAVGLDTPRGTSFGFYLLFSHIIYVWFRRLAGRHRLNAPFDLGFLLYLAWWLKVPFYLFKVRGPRALWPILGFLAAYLSTYWLSLALYMAMVGEG